MDSTERLQREDAQPNAGQQRHRPERVLNVLLIPALVAIGLIIACSYFGKETTTEPSLDADVIVAEGILAALGDGPVK